MASLGASSKPAAICCWSTTERFIPRCLNSNRKDTSHPSGGLGQQPPGEVLPPDACRQEAARARDQGVGADHRNPRSIFGSRRGVAMRSLRATLMRFQSLIGAASGPARADITRRARAWLLRLIGSLWPSAANGEIADELESHLQLHADDNIRCGLAADEARRQARLALYGVEWTKEAYRDREGFPMIDSLILDARYGVRTLAKARAFSLAAVVILALGIGANTAIFSVVNAVILRPLPFADSSRIMRVWHTPPKEQFSGRTTFAVSPANYLDWRAQNHVFERMAIYTSRRLNLTGRGEPEALGAASVSADFFHVVGIRPILGRTFTLGDDEPG